MSTPKTPRKRKASKAEVRERRRHRRVENRQAALAAISGRRGRVLKLAEVEAISGLKRSVLYELIAAGSFPAPIALTPTARGWVETEVDSWLDQRIAERDAAVA